MAGGRQESGPGPCLAQTSGNIRRWRSVHVVQIQQHTQLPMIQGQVMKDEDWKRASGSGSAGEAS